MTRKILYALLLGVMPAAALADGVITGQIISKESGEPLDFVNVQLADANGKRMAVGTSSDENGHFALPKVKDGDYTVIISNMGSVTQERPVKVAGANVDIGTVKLAEDTKMLQEVVVEGVRSQMRFELDKKVFTVDANISAAGISASELLESIPSVEVDQDGEVSLRGNSSVTVWINGKDSGLTADNRAQILEQIPAESIERVEVITNPSAKFSPEGTAGIINIVLKKDTRAGYFGSTELSANSRGGGNLGANVNFNSGRWETFAGLGLRMRHSNGGSTMERDYADGFFTDSRGERRNHGNNIFLRLGATYHLTDRDEFSLSGFGMLGHRWGHNSTLYTSDLPGQWTLNHNLTRERGDMRGAHAELGYIHRWTDDHHLDLSLAFNHWGGPNHNSYLQKMEYADDSGESLLRDQSQDIGVNSIEAKADYTLKIAKAYRLEAGFNGNYNHENTPVSVMQSVDGSQPAINPDLYNRFIYNNNISALYATFGGTVGKLSFSGGLRSESWQVRTRSLAYGQSEAEVPLYRKNFFALFPSAYISYSLPYDNEVQVNYTRRIRRPWGGQLNSFHDISDPTNVSFGNPELQPQYSNSFELNYIKTWTYHMLSVSAYMRTTSNMMNRIRYLDGGVMYSTFANIADENNSGCEIVSKNSFAGGKLDFTTTVNLYNNHISGWHYDFTAESGNIIPLDGKSQNSFAWDARVMASVRLPWGIGLQATGNYRSKQLEAQGSRQGGWSVDAGVRKAFGNWTVSLNCRDIFDSRKFRNTISGTDYTERNERWRNGRTLRLTVKYSFGNMKSKMPRERPGGDGDDSFDGSGYSSEGME